MIGQNELRTKLNKLVNRGNFPRFTIIVGVKGSGKKTLVRELIKQLTNGLYEECGIKADDVRELIRDAYKIHSTVAYFIPDADNMSNAAKNALLKVTEEPPNNAYFIMTLEDENNTLETIRSRGTVFHMDRYTPDEIIEYVEQKYGDTSEGIKIITDICETPGDVDILVKMGVRDFYEYVQLVADNIIEVGLANAFKISSKIALKDDADGYSLKLFWKAFIKVCLAKFFNTGDIKYLHWEKTTAMFLVALKNTKLNRQMLFDSWLLEVRNE